MMLQQVLSATHKILLPSSIPDQRGGSWSGSCLIRIYSGTAARWTAPNFALCSSAAVHGPLVVMGLTSQELSMEPPHELAGEAPTLPLPDFEDAYQTQRVLEAAMLAAEEKRPVKLDEVK